MRTRTHLTTPDGRQPEAVTAEPDVDQRGADVYVPGFALPSEPRLPGRYRTHLIALATLLVLVVIGWTALQVITAGSDFDPALDDPALDGAPQQQP